MSAVLPGIVQSHYVVKKYGQLIGQGAETSYSSCKTGVACYRQPANVHPLAPFAMAAEGRNLGISQESA